MLGGATNEVIMDQPINPVQQIDFAFYVIFGISIVLLFGITLVALFMVYHYKHERHPVASKLKDNVWLEIIWILLPSLLVISMSYYGWIGFKALRSVPDGAMEVQVVGRMFSWSFEYPDGKRSNIMYVPVGTPIRLKITSDDVIHSLYIPAFRIKMDAVPGMETYAWFDPETLGSYDILCSEYCGVKHANMLSTVEVVSIEDFERWLKSESTAQQTAVALLENNGCLSCHSTDGSIIVAPTLKGLWGKRLLLQQSGVSIRKKLDRAVLEQILRNPETVRDGSWKVMMPAYDSLTPDEITAIAEYLKTLPADEDRKKSDKQ
jgi:cytochrome c oxidase subunit 2